MLVCFPVSPPKIVMEAVSFAFVTIFFVSGGKIAKKKPPYSTKAIKRPTNPCVPAGIRTQDPILKRDVLYLLSY